jgi:hypothetical protein
LISSARITFGKHRSFARHKLPGLLTVNHRPDQVRREKIRGELNAAETGVQNIGEAFHRQRLGKTRHAFEQNVTACEDSRQQPVYHRLLANNFARQFVPRFLYQVLCAPYLYIDTACLLCLHRIFVSSRVTRKRADQLR